MPGRTVTRKRPANRSRIEKGPGPAARPPCPAPENPRVADCCGPRARAGALPTPANGRSGIGSRGRLLGGAAIVDEPPRVAGTITGEERWSLPSPLGGKPRIRASFPVSGTPSRPLPPRPHGGQDECAGAGAFPSDRFPARGFPPPFAFVPVLERARAGRSMGCRSLGTHGPGKRDPRSHRVLEALASPVLARLSPPGRGESLAAAKPAEFPINRGGRSPGTGWSGVAREPRPLAKGRPPGSRFPGNRVGGCLPGSLLPLWRRGRGNW